MLFRSGSSLQNCLSGFDSRHQLHSFAHLAVSKPRLRRRPDCCRRGFFCVLGQFEATQRGVSPAQPACPLSRGWCSLTPRRLASRLACVFYMTLQSYWGSQRPTERLAVHRRCSRQRLQSIVSSATARGEQLHAASDPARLPALRLRLPCLTRLSSYRTAQQVIAFGVSWASSSSAVVHLP